MANSTLTSSYTAMLRAQFNAYRHSRFHGQDFLFEMRPESGAIVFEHNHAVNNLLIPPIANTFGRTQIVGMIPSSQRHKYFGSMQSSQALAQSVFGTISVLGRLTHLSSVVAEDGQPAFGLGLNQAALVLEKQVNTLKEPRPTSVDVWLSGPYQVAIECKLAEQNFGTCSRPRLSAEDSAFQNQYCDGTYTRQRDRTARCSLTEEKVSYWNYLEVLFGWKPDTDHRPCPLAPTYQLVRNILAATVDDAGFLDINRGHALIIYDQRNPTMSPGGEADQQWRAANEALRARGKLRRLSWQALITQWPTDELLDWLKSELDAKYGLRP